MSLHKHIHTYQPENANKQHQAMLARQMAASFNKRVAVGMTRLFSAMPMFWVIVLIMAGYMVANSTLLRFDPAPWPFLLTFGSLVQLPLMIVIMVGQDVLSQKQAVHGDEMYYSVKAILSDIEQVEMHQGKQDEVLLALQDKLQHLIEQGQPVELLPTQVESRQTFDLEQLREVLAPYLPRRASSKTQQGS